MATDEEIAEKSARLQQLRDELINGRLEREATERELANELTMAQLEVEEAKLLAQIEEENRRSESVVKSASAPIEAVKADMERAVAMQRAIANKVTEKPATREDTPDTPDTTDASEKPALAAPPAPTVRTKQAVNKADQEKGK